MASVSITFAGNLELRRHGNLAVRLTSELLHCQDKTLQELYLSVFVCNEATPLPYFAITFHCHISSPLRWELQKMQPHERIYRPLRPADSSSASPGNVDSSSRQLPIEPDLQSRSRRGTNLRWACDSCRTKKIAVRQLPVPISALFKAALPSPITDKYSPLLCFWAKANAK